ncbi:MAG TPA: YceI family protein [Arenimonas sp.]|nr:YceI family protein [Arenimonas sp.]
MLKPLLLGLMLVGSIGAAQAETKAYAIDPGHTQVYASYLHAGFSNIAIRFNTVEGEFQFDAAKPANSTLNVKVPISSLDSGVAKLDAHLSSPDFFDAAQFPEATFKSTKVTAVGKGKLKLLGDLTIHGVTKPVTFDVTINGIAVHPMSKKPSAGFDAVTKIKRSDFGVGKYVPMVSDEITMRITMEASEAK